MHDSLYLDCISCLLCSIGHYSDRQFWSIIVLDEQFAIHICFVISATLSVNIPNLVLYIGDWNVNEIKPVTARLEVPI